MNVRIAVFNDYPHNLRLIKEVLSRKGFEVYTFLQDFVEIDEVVRLQPQLMILAYLMGYDQDQLKIIERLHNHPEASQIPIIICSTGVIQGYSSHCLLDIPVLHKPFHPSDLLEQVDYALYRRSTAGAGG